MYEIDKVKFGSFVSSSRKELGLTQKELAQKLFVSDKAVSKWETGASMPDITLLIPLSEILGVSVTELLECEKKQEVKDQYVEVLVKKAIHMSNETKQQTSKKYGFVFTCACLFLLLEMSVMIFSFGLSRVINEMGWAVLLWFILGVYTCFFMKEQLPTYYDEHPIDYYTSGIFRLHLTGLSLNNSNWPYIVKVMRVWSIVGLILLPWLFYLHLWIGLFRNNYNVGLVLTLLISLIGSIYYVGKKYE